MKRRYTTSARVEALQTAIDRAGGLLAFCEKLNVSHQAVAGWRKRGYVPPLRAVAIENRFGVERTALVHPDVVAAITTPASALVNLI